MDLSERMTPLDRRHPWEQARSTVIGELIGRATITDQPVRYLDVGAGDAWLGAGIAEGLPAGSTGTLWDSSYDSGEIATFRTEWPECEFTTDQPSGRFDLITLLDVLEHVEHSEPFLRSIVEMNAAVNATIVVTVPAYQSLFTDHDTALRHHRRYSPRQCRQLLTGAGLSIETEGGLFASLLPVRALQKALQTLRHRQSSADEVAGIGAWAGSQRTTSLMCRALEADGRLSLAASRRGCFVPGLSYWAVCRSAHAAGSSR